MLSRHCRESSWRRNNGRPRIFSNKTIRRKYSTGGFSNLHTECDQDVKSTTCRNAPRSPKLFLDISLDMPLDSYSLPTKESMNVCMLESFHCSKSICAFGIPAEVFGNISAIPSIQKSTRLTSRATQLFAGLSASIPMNVLVMGGKQSIVEQ